MSGSAGSEAPEEPNNVTVPSALVARKLWLLVGMMKYAKEIDELDSLLLLRILFYFYAFFSKVSSPCLIYLVGTPIRSRRNMKTYSRKPTQTCGLLDRIQDASFDRKLLQI